MMGPFEGLEPVERETTASIIADRIRERIMDGTFAPGTQLGEAQLASRLAVSRGSVREAMQRLIQEGLLRNERNRGVFVIELDASDVADIYLARGAVERQAMRLLAGNADEELFDRLESTIDGMEQAAQDKNWAAVAEHDLRFHEALVASTGSLRLVRIFRTLLAETRMCMIELESAYTVWRDLVAEHRELLAAMRRGDEVALLELVDAHFDSAVRGLAADR